ncbi:hypothetical protein Pan44_52790 [Caulifigura coniformis]|uniref:Uncharacterized protein n=1 Tax=Caulifigura coniformis TaxID=2527983 RepID=A0A517SM72_9PLAN|nr:hypothetical protein [Caulifigura coniformis]QDT57212.1 hypothetical protein Pan44_52790 [Caulifigura coniformis]
MIVETDDARAAQFYVVLDEYCRHSSNDENLIDLLADAMYWCSRYGRSFDAALDAARRNFDAETLSRPAGRRSAMSEPLFKLAEIALDFANEYTEVLDFEEYATVSEIETKMLAFGNLLESSDRDAFLKDELRQATETLAYLRHRKSIKPG